MCEVEPIVIEQKCRGAATCSWPGRRAAGGASALDVGASLSSRERCSSTSSFCASSWCLSDRGERTRVFARLRPAARLGNTRSHSRQEPARHDSALRVDRQTVNPREKALGAQQTLRNEHTAPSARVLPTHQLQRQCPPPSQQLPMAQQTRVSESPRSAPGPPPPRARSPRRFCRRVQCSADLGVEWRVNKTAGTRACPSVSSPSSSASLLASPPPAKAWRRDQSPTSVRFFECEHGGEQCVAMVHGARSRMWRRAALSGGKGRLAPCGKD